MASVKITFWAKLFASSARKVNAVEWNADHVAIQGWRSKSTLSYDLMSDQFHVVPGLFWDQVIAKTGDCRPLVFGGIDKTRSSLLQAEANELLAKHWESRYRTSRAAIMECEQRWLSLIDSSRYFRKSQLNVWLESVSPLVCVLNNKHRKHYPDVQAESAAATISLALVDSEAQRASYNTRYTRQELEKYQGYLDRVESKPLSPAQRLACVQHDDANLVLAGAGTGKTSTMVGKAGYLMASGQAQPSELLLLAFGNKAAREMEGRAASRLGIRSLKIKTFHSLGLEIIGAAEGKRPSLSDMAEDDLKLVEFIARTLVELKRDPSFRSAFIRYFLFGLLPSKSLFDFKSKQEYIAYCKQHEPRTLNGELVKSYEELTIANFLFQMGVRYQYEAPYKIETADARYRQYKPDFYLTDYDIYLEHFALDAQGMPPSFMDQREYLDGVQWKRELHKQHGTRLLETYSRDQADGVLLDRLEEMLKSAHVEFDPVPDDKLLDRINGLPEATDFTRLLADVLKAFKRARWEVAEFIERAKSIAERAGTLLLIKVFEPLYERYQEYLAQSGSIDFEDMISRAIDYVRNGAFQSTYRYILVDEFQDISGPRAELIKALLSQRSGSSLFCVGDDWQAIYRFAGSDLSYTQDFGKHFGSTAINALDTTYRFNDKIGDVASRFVQRNPGQIKKSINSFRKVQRASVTLVPSTNEQAGLESALRAIDQQAEFGASVLLLARFNFRLPQNLEPVRASFPRLKLQPMSVHASKGKEADYVVVLGLDQGKFGFPSEKATPSLLEMLLPPREAFAFAEERRLFYVGLTRAKHHVYLVSDPTNSSEFIRELRTYGSEIDQLSAGKAGPLSWSEATTCPSCQTGYLSITDSRLSRIFSCSNAPYCEHTEQGCQKCGERTLRVADELLCQNAACGERVVLCPVCGGSLRERRGKGSTFWGCSNYRGDEPGSCRYTTRSLDQSQSGRRHRKGR
jgi:DNA helicase IV